MRVVIQFVIVFMLGINSSYGDIVFGVEGESMPEVVSVAVESPFIIEAPADAIVINFDDLSAPCLFSEATALRNQYGGLGVSFDGPDAKDGGAIMNECGGFGVSGHSSPNFLAFNTEAGLSGGGIAQGPEIIYFEPPVNQVQANVGAGWGQTGMITMEAYNAANELVDSDTVAYRPELQTISVQASGITKVILSFTNTYLVFDDLAFVQGGWGIAYDALFDSTSDLDILREYRDEILSQKARGKLYRKLLYKNSEEALEVLLDNPELILQARDLIEANRDAVLDVLNGNEGVIYNTDEIIAFLKAFAKKSPPRLKALAKLVKKGMLRRKRKGKLFLGFRLE